MIGAIIAGICTIPFVVLITEIAAGLAPVRSSANASGTVPAIAILIPAHNEATGIAATIGAIRAASPADTRIIVVADNCTDDTAAIARRAGATVVERTNPDQRGKGYALAFGRDALRADPPDVVIVLDADCVPHDDTIGRVATTAVATGRPVQAINLVDPPIDRDAMGRVSTFAFRVKNLVRQRGLQRLTGTCVLTGTGMAFPWNLFEAAQLATADSVEDLALGLNFVLRGTAPLLCDGTLVTSASPSADAAVAQRTRWEHGFIATAVRVAPEMLAAGIRKPSWKAFWLGLHLIVPPLALLIMVAAAVLAGLTLVAPAAAIGFGAIYAVALLAIFVTWASIGRDVLPAALLAKIPAYILWKLPIYLRLSRGADRRWTRTERD